jgi:hypothetical protein
MEYAYDYKPKKASYKSFGINEDTFSKWSKSNMYRTNYTNTFTTVGLIPSHAQKPLPPKNKAIPGYQGFVPGFRSENTFGKTFTQITKNRFQDKNLRSNTTGLSTTGYNFAKFNFGD